MKKIGILTFHRAHNYGAVLQTYALQETLKSLGYKVEVIDYRQRHIDRLYAPFSFVGVLKIVLKLKLRYLCRYIYNYNYRAAKLKKYSSFVTQYLNITSPCNQNNIPQNIDNYVIGSDQVWGLQCTAGLDRVFFGDFKRNTNSKVVGYAISSNDASIERVNKCGKLKSYISNFSTLSFRESNIRDLVMAKSGVKARVDIDPTLLANSEIWDKMIDHSWRDKKYVLYYNLRGDKKSKKELKNKATKLANKMNCEMIDILDSKYGPIDFVSAFKYAQHVITSSFHGTVFAIIFERSLQSIKLNDGHDGRYVNLLNTIGAEQMLVDIDFTPEVKEIDYNPIKERLNNLREDSLNYLSSI